MKAKMAGVTLRSERNQAKGQRKGVTLLSTCFTRSREPLWQNKAKKEVRKKRMNLLRGPNQHRLVPGMAFRELAASPENGREARPCSGVGHRGVVCFDETPGMRLRFDMDHGSKWRKQPTTDGSWWEIGFSCPGCQPKPERDCQTARVELTTPALSENPSLVIYTRGISVARYAVGEAPGSALFTSETWPGAVSNCSLPLSR